MTTSTIHPDRPVLRVIRGDATAEEVAAILAIVAAASAARSEPDGDPAASVWSAGHSRRATRVSGRGSGESGRDAWRTSFWPS